MSSRVSYAIAVLILLLATGLRMWELTTVPIGLHAEEVLTLRLSDTVRAGDIRVLYPVGGGDARENLYYTALAFTRLGTGTGSIGYRMMSVLANIVMLTLVYTTGVRLFGRVAGLSAMALLAVMMWASLLARLAVAQAFLPLLVVGVMLALARALPVYRQYSTESTKVTAFAAVGALLGMGFYLHAASLMIVLGAMAFITYIIVTERPLSTRRLSYIGFSILMIIILVMPYLLSSINLPDLAASSRLFNSNVGLLRSLLTGFMGIAIQGDLNPAFNVP
ncbi:MAG: glycosyltransferase family 39 protein, partial [Anaerolineae bacterium]|nr:glycosyltransferase family 39 protein [Anaerolineae bacterium]